MKPNFWLSLILLYILSATVSGRNSIKSPTPTDLKQVHQAISATQNQISKTASEQKKIDASIVQTNQQLNQAKTELEHIRRQHQTSIKQLRTLQNNLDNTQTKIAEAQTQLSRLLNAHYRNRQPNSVFLLLKKDNTNQKGRALEYLRYINTANEQVIQRLRTQQDEMKIQQKELAKQRQQLTSLQQKQQQIVKKLNNQHLLQQNKFSELNQKLTAQNKQLQTLKADEKRLNSLLSRLSAQSTMRRIERTQNKNTANTQSAHNKNTNNPAYSSETSTHLNNNNSSLTAEDMTLQAAETVQEKARTGLAQKQGRLPRPVNGKIAGKFGEQRPTGGTWKGIFIAANNTPVRSISSGHVIYAAFIQGYGNTIIIDHGEGYLSIYTALSSIHVSTGKTVNAGQNIGISGKLPDGQSGLYFEIRYHNQAMNPLSWIT